MEQQNSINVQLMDENIVTNQVVRRTMTVKEGIKELTELKQNVLKLEQQKQQINKALNDKQLEKQLVEVENNLELIKKLEKDWEEIIAPKLEELKKECKKNIKFKKAETGYDRLTELSAKMQKANSILAEIALENDLDMHHPVMMELRKEFDK